MYVEQQDATEIKFRVTDMWCALLLENDSWYIVFWSEWLNWLELKWLSLLLQRDLRTGIDMKDPVSVQMWMVPNLVIHSLRWKLKMASWPFGKSSCTGVCFTETTLHPLDKDSDSYTWVAVGLNLFLFWGNVHKSSFERVRTWKKNTDYTGW